MAKRSETVDVWERHRQRQRRAARQEIVERRSRCLEVVAAIGVSGVLFAALWLLGAVAGRGRFADAAVNA